MLRISDLKARIKILRSTETKSDEGLGPELSWEEIKSVWMCPLKQRVAPVSVLDGPSIMITQGFMCRPCDILRNDRLIYQNETYDILDVDKGNPSYYIITSKRLVS